MRYFNLMAFALSLFVMCLASQAGFAGEKTRAALQTDLDTYKLRDYNAGTNYDRLIDITDSAFNKQSDGLSVVNICGEATTINNNTVYYGADITLTANTINGMACDINATGNTTEATADAPVYTNQAFDVLGMTCRNEADANADISFTLRSAEAATTPSVTCTIADGERDCVADLQTTTQIAAGATVAVAAASTGDIADGNGFICTLYTSY